MKKSNFIWTSLLIISIACILYILFSDISITDDTNNGDYLYLILFIISAVIIFSYVIRAKIKISEEYCDITNAHEKYVKTLGNKIDELEKKKSELENINKDNEDAIRRKDFIINCILKTKDPFKNLASLYADVVLCNYRHSYDYLKNKRPPAPKAADVVSELKTETKLYIEQYKTMLYKYEYLLSQFPELGKYVDNYVEVSNICNDIANKNTRNWYDKAQEWLSKDEYRKLSEDERNQLALNRYISSFKKTNWQIGRDYELYIGYIYRKEGWKVTQYGIEKKLNDLGRDIIATKTDENGNLQVLIIQCKIWNKNKEIHENAICQLYGTTIQYILENNHKKPAIVRPVFVTTTMLSNTAMKFAQYLGVQVRIEKLGEFPRIKCNVNKEFGEKIFHLPFDQQYDRTKIENEGEFYAWSVEEAVLNGFRHACKWYL